MTVFIDTNRPCPWCGGHLIEPQFCGRYRVNSEAPQQYKYRAKCVKCGAKGPAVTDLGNSEAREGCIKAWDAGCATE